MRVFPRNRRLSGSFLAVGLLVSAVSLTATRSNNASSVPLPDGVAVFGAEQVILEQDANVLSGDAATNGQAVLQSETLVEGSLFADHAILGNGARILGNLEANRITAPNATIEGETITPRQKPNYSIPTLPPVTPGTQDLSIGAGETVTLEPGAYDEIRIGENAKAILEGGDYHLRSLHSGRNVIFAIAEPVTLNILETAFLGERTIFNFNPDLNINQIKINFHGQNLTVGKSSFAAGVIHAPNALVFVHKDSIWRGRIAGKRVGVGKDAIIARESAFAKPSDPSKIIEDPGGGFVIVDEILLNLDEDIPISILSQILRETNGHLVGFLDLTNEYKIHIETTTIDELDAVIGTIENLGIAGVTSVGKNAVMFTR